MESTVTQDLEGHSVWLPEIKMEPEDNDESASEPQVIEVEPTPFEFAFVKVEPMTEEPLDVENQPEIENLQESDAIKHEPTSPPGTPTHSTTLDNITSQLDQVTPESSNTQLHFDFQQEVYVKPELKANQCTVCYKVYSRTTHLTRHLLTHSDKRNHKCDTCGKSFNTSCILKQHRLTHEPASFNCADCNKLFSCKRSLASHIKQQHVCESDRIRYACSLCSRSYYHTGQLTKHLKTHNLQHCEICNLECADLQSLRTHMTVHHEGEEKHRCQTCEKVFIILEDLTSHGKLYCSKPFKCRYCELRFPTNDRLDIHVKKQHSITRYDCDICSKTFICKKNLRQHKSIHIKPEQCGYCQNRFLTKDRLELHVKKQHSITQYDCDICSKTFICKKNLRQHKSIHTKPERCDICNVGFSQKFLLQHHKSKHHSTNT